MNTFDKLFVSKRLISIILAYKHQTFSVNYCDYNRLVSIIGLFSSISYLKSKNLRREVWTVKVTKICRTHFNII
jgi:hypothetical protein